MTIVAAFDFDGTITRRDSLLPFLRFIAGDSRFVAGMFRSLPVLAGLGVRLVGAQGAKESLLGRFLRGWTRSDLYEAGSRFSRTALADLVRPSALDKLAEHRESGHCCLLVSASLDCYLEPWATACGFDGVLCSRLQFDDEGRATGRLAGVNCKGAEKVERLKMHLGDAWPPATLYAYGDSGGDRELLAAADHAFYRIFRD